MHNGAPDAFYTSDDHSFRENDPYARAKYDLTMRWLAPVMKHGDLLYNVGVGGGYFNHLASARSLKIAGCEPDAEVFARALATAPPGVELFNCTLEEFAEDRPPAKFVVIVPPPRPSLTKVGPAAQVASGATCVIDDDAVSVP